MTTSTRPRHLATAMGALAGSEVFGKVATLVVFAWCARVIGVDAFGVLSYGLGLGLLIAVLPSLGLDARIIQLIGGDTPSAGTRLASLNVLRAGLTLPAVLIAVPFALGHPVADRVTIGLMVFAGVVDTFTDAQRAICVVLDRQHWTAVAHVIHRTATLLLMALALLLHPGAVTAAAAFAGSSLIGWAVMAMMTRRTGVRATYRDLRRAHLRDLLVATPVIGGDAVVSMLLFRVDVLLIQAFAGMVAVGQYTIAYRLIETVLFVSWSISRALTPDLARADHGRQLDGLVRVGLVLIVAVYVPYGVALAISGQGLIAWIFGAEYVTGSLLLWLAPAPVLFGVGHFAATVMFARRPDPAVLVAALAALVVNVLVNLALLPTWGVAGAGLAKTLAYAVQAAISCWALSRLAHPPLVWRGVLVACMATVVAALPQVVGLPVAVGLVCAAGVYLTIWYRLGRRWDAHTVAWLGSLRRAAPT